MKHAPVSRMRLLARVESHLAAHSSPRLVMSLMVSVTALGGLASSLVLLKVGVLGMGLRYALATVMAYGVFLGCVWVWLQTLQASPAGDPTASGASARQGSGRGENDDVDGGRRLMNAVADAIDRHDAAQMKALTTPPPQPTPAGLLPANLGEGAVSNAAYVPVGSSSASAGGTRSSDGGGGEGDGEWAALLVILLAMLLVLVVVAVGVHLISQAPVMLAEVALDGAVAGALYQRLRAEDQQHWLVSAWQHTRWVLLLLVVTMGGIGWGLQQVVPDAVTLGQALGWGIP